MADGLIPPDSMMIRAIAKHGKAQNRMLFMDEIEAGSIHASYHPARARGSACFMKFLNVKVHSHCRTLPAGLGWLLSEGSKKLLSPKGELQ